MILVERHIISKNCKEFKKIDKLGYLSKNLYNSALYYLKQNYEKNGTHIGYNELEKEFRLNKQQDYVALPPNTSQQILMLVEKNYKSFFKSVLSYKKNKNKFKGIPKPPKYKDKVNGRNILIFTINQAKLKGDKIYFPKKTELKPLTTKVDNLKQVRIVPQTSCYVIEVVYEKKETINENLNFSNYMSIDLGLNNLATVIFNQPGIQPFLINGRQVKSINQYYNKKKSKLQSFLKGNLKTSNKIKKLSLKRNNKINNYFHKVSKFLVNWADCNNIGNIVIGYNSQWKQEINLGKRNNQNFVNIPHLKLIQQITYKAELKGIKVICNEESYTSKCSALDLEPVCKHDEYVGKRVKRGLFQSTKTLINADVNGALNILRKVTCNDEFLASIGVVVTPIRVNL